MTKVKVEPGVCGLTAVITAESEDGMFAQVSVETRCPRIQKLAEGLDEEINAYAACMPGPGQKPFPARLFEENDLHAACPVVAGILKAIEAECGLALKRDVSICFLND